MAMFPITPFRPLAPDLDLSPLRNALAGYQKGTEQAYEGETARQMGSLYAAGKPDEAAKYAFTRGDPELGMRTAQFAAQQKEAAEKELERGTMALAKVYDIIGAEKDPAKQSALQDRLIGSHPRLKSAYERLGLPPEIARDPVVVGKYVQALAAPYRDKLATRVLEAQATENEASAREKDAKAGAAGNKGSGFDSFKDLVKYEQDLREEFTKQPAVKDYGTVRDSFSKIKGAAGDGTGASDMSMIFSYMKMLDPSSTVREGEYANAQNTAGVPAQISNLYNKMLTGAFLTPAQRTEFTKQAQNLYGTHERQYNSLRGQYEVLARRANIDPSRVTLDFGRVDAGERNPYGAGPARPGAPAEPPTPTFNPPPRAAAPSNGIPEGGPGSKSSPAYPPDFETAKKLPPGTWFINPETKQLRQRQ